MWEIKKRETRERHTHTYTHNHTYLSSRSGNTLSGLNSARFCMETAAVTKYALANMACCREGNMQSTNLSMSFSVRRALIGTRGFQSGLANLSLKKVHTYVYYSNKEDK